VRLCVLESNTEIGSKE